MDILYCRASFHLPNRLAFLSSRSSKIKNFYLNYLKAMLSLCLDLVWLLSFIKKITIF